MESNVTMALVILFRPLIKCGKAGLLYLGYKSLDNHQVTAGTHKNPLLLSDHFYFCNSEMVSLFRASSIQLMSDADHLDKPVSLHYSHATQLKLKTAFHSRLPSHLIRSAQAAPGFPAYSPYHNIAYYLSFRDIKFKSIM